MTAIKHLFHINSPKEKVFNAISSIDGLSNWWTTKTSGNSKAGGIIEFRFGEHGPDMKVIESKNNERIVWECVGNQSNWIGHKITIALDENDGKTRVRFMHEGYTTQDDSYAAVCFSWARYMESLRQYCQTGKGEAFGSEGYRK